jgi:hypothetical protein
VLVPVGSAAPVCTCTLVRRLPCTSCEHRRSGVPLAQALQLVLSAPPTPPLLPWTSLSCLCVHARTRVCVPVAYVAADVQHLLWVDPESVLVRRAPPPPSLARFVTVGPPRACGRGHHACCLHPRPCPLPCLLAYRTFNGMFIAYSSIPKGWRWMYQITPYNHVTNALAMSQFHDSGKIIEFVRAPPPLHLCGWTRAAACTFLFSNRWCV